MLDQPVDLARGRECALERAEILLGEGLPIDLTRQASISYLNRCETALNELERGLRSPQASGRGNESDLGLGGQLCSVKLLTAMTIAASHIDPVAAIEYAARTGNLAEPRGGTNGGDLVRAYALVARGFASPGPEHTDARVLESYEALDIIAKNGEAQLLPAASALLLVGLLERGEVRELDIQLLEQRNAEAGKPDSATLDPAKWFHCLRSILDGDTDTAEKQAEELYLGSSHSGTNALALYTTQIGMIRWMQGRVDGAEAGFLAARREYPDQLLWTASLAWLWLRQGRTSAAENLLRTLPEPNDLPRDRYWLSTLVALVEIAVVTGSRERAEQLRDLLHPYSDHLVSVGMGVAFWGTAARSLGLLEERLGRLSEAQEFLERAIETSGRIGALAWHAEAQIELAEFAIRHQLTEVPAYDLLAEARATSAARGFAGLARRAMYRPRIRVLGAFEVTSLCGVRADWTSRKARELLKMLIAARGTSSSREVYMDALWPDEPPAQLGNRFSVAVNVIRRALDPNRLLPTQHHVVTEGESIRLEIDHLDIDLERFLRLAKNGDPESAHAAIELYRGEAFSDEPYADWAVATRDHAQHVRREIGRSLG